MDEQQIGDEGCGGVARLGEVVLADQQQDPDQEGKLHEQREKMNGIDTRQAQPEETTGAAPCGGFEVLQMDMGNDETAEDEEEFDYQIAGFHEGEIRDPETAVRSEEHTYELQSLMRISYCVFCLHKHTQRSK